MGIDPSIPLHAGAGVQPMANPLVMANQIMQFKTGQQNLLNQQSTAAANGDMQQAIDPATGKLDPLKYNQLLAADPRAARAMQASSQAGASNAQTTIANTGALQQQAFQRFTVTGNALGSLLATGKPITPKDVTNVVGDLVASPDHPMDAQEGAQLIAQAHGMNPDQLTQAVRARYAFAQQSAAALAAQVAMANNGQQQVPVNTNPIAGPVGQMPGNPVQNRLGPEALATQIPGQDANGQPITRALGSVLGQEGAATGGAPAQPGAPQNNANTASANLATAANALKAAGVPTDQIDKIMQNVQMPGVVNQGAPTAPAAPNTEPAGAIANGPAPGVTEAATSAAKASTDIYNTAISQISTIPQVRGALQSLNSEINLANPGPLNEVFTKIGASLSQLGIIKGDQATASNLMQKDTMLAVMNQLNGLSGGSTDAKMSGFIHATPNGEMTTQSAKAAVGMIMGSLDYSQAEAQAVQAYAQANGTAKLQQFKVNWVKQNPSTNAYQFQYLPEAERSKYMKSLSPTQQKALVQDMEKAGTLPSGPGA